MNNDTNKNVFTVSSALEEEYLDQLPESKTENHLGKVIAAYRKKAKMTQQELADKLGVNKGTVYQYEKGRLMPRYYRLNEIVALLKIPEEAFAGYTLPTIEYVERETNPALEGHEDSLALMTFLKAMGNTDMQTFYFYNKALNKLILQDGALMYQVPNEKMQEAMQHIKSYAEYVLREMCKTCETDEVSKRFNPPDADDRYPTAQVIGGEVTFN